MTQTSSNNGGIDEILVEEEANVRTFILNRPKQLNALTFQMWRWTPLRLFKYLKFLFIQIYRLLELFHASEGNSKVKMIILKGNGRAFCAGGDVTFLAHNVHQGNWKLSADFIRELFTLNNMMATYSKPQVFILNGIVMGGGLVVSVHGRFRVATEKTKLHVHIFFCRFVLCLKQLLGIVPGASHFYSRLPGFFGEYAGLTGARFDGAEMLDVGLATHFVPSEKLPFLKQELAKVNTSDADVISVIISRFSTIPNLKAESPCHKMKIIDLFLSKNNRRNHIFSCKFERWMHSFVFRSEITLMTGSLQPSNAEESIPISLKVYLRSIREGRHQDVGSCLIQEYRMLCLALKETLAKILSRDAKPYSLTRIEILRCIDDEDWEDLKLPPYAIAKL
ncbi:hypothetical protein H5410_012409 [Solanum commersonii]|uniref:3-hydroxyisobutyryl-CoA hydrolase n=1 Tax=Solanum commersonii TaxID=4109 RepID=A0A9J6ASS3_SOLCO|nr:hypothetical protein H5410_012409 [Solanum commersonii]